MKRIMASIGTVVGAPLWQRLLIAIALSASIPGVAAFAATCGPLKQAASVDLIAAPNGVQMIPVTLNGMPKKLLLGTAGGRSTLSKQAVADLGLHPMSAARGARLLNRTGYASNEFVFVSTFQLGRLQGKDVQFVVSPNPQFGSNPALPVDGELAGDLMETFDVEMDFSASKLNFFSTDHCDGKVVYWPASAIAIVPYRSTKPGTNVPDSHLRVQVTLDGKELRAVIDTGSARSTISAGAAQYIFHVTTESPGAVPLGTVANEPNQKVFRYVFGNLAFEGVTINNPNIVVFPDMIGSKDPDNRARTGSLVRRVDDNNLRPEMTIGMDVLKKLHLYVASREHKIYITSATPPASPSP